MPNDSPGPGVPASGTRIRAKPTPYRGQVCVLELEASETGPPLEVALTEVSDGPARIILVDCLEVGAVPPAVCDELEEANRQLAQQGRQLVVVNASPGTEARLQVAGVNTAATEMRPSDTLPEVDDQPLPVADELAAAIRERELAVSHRDVVVAERERRLPGSDDQLAAAHDRVAAALDRYEAAVDRLQAAIYLEQARRDELTGTLQRRAGLDQLRREVDRAQRTGTDLVVAFVDVDHLKQINDEHGHAAGDAALAATGHALQSGLRSYDITIRYGGDEFVCVLPQLDLAAASRRMEELRHKLAAGRPAVSISIGLAQLLPDEGVSALLARADAHLYRGRAQRRSDQQDASA